MRWTTFFVVFLLALCGATYAGFVVNGVDTSGGGGGYSDAQAVTALLTEYPDLDVESTSDSTIGHTHVLADVTDAGTMAAEAAADYPKFADVISTGAVQTLLADYTPLTAGISSGAVKTLLGAYTPTTNAFAVTILTQGAGSTVTITRTSANLFAVALTNNGTITFADSWTTNEIGTARLDLLCWSYTVTFDGATIGTSVTNFVLATNRANALVFDKAWRETLWDGSQFSPR